MKMEPDEKGEGGREGLHNALSLPPPGPPTPLRRPSVVVLFALTAAMPANSDLCMDGQGTAARLETSPSELRGMEPSSPAASRRENGLETKAKNLCSQICSPLLQDGGFQCSCYPGFRLDTDNKSCIPIQNVNGSDSSVENYSRCLSETCSQLCHDSPQFPAPQCSCYGGFRLRADRRTCEDVDECFLQLDLCDRNTQICENTEGSYRCLLAYNRTEVPQIIRTTLLQTVGKGLGLGDGNCAEGFRFDPLLKICNVQCPPGFSFSNRVNRCLDVDECRTGEHNCVEGEEVCVNDPGGFHCERGGGRGCAVGFQWNPPLGRCVDIDECSEDLHNCLLNQDICVNTIGGFRCNVKCQAGFRFIFANETCLGALNIDFTRAKLEFLAITNNSGKSIV
ncbi:unnamed protein product [Cyprideis torosa]|uniref:Uncharacterized protein n=1 Tax=Cyprideis torosa TaxID=163714 RepID=A0A7R8ZT17_9CRUS|nr:unnamed protein product [Cyprideis torosa]CAG0896976.1 unnamed protein product [Cyprideis torosa]